jgi:hypothetical protein
MLVIIHAKNNPITIPIHKFWSKPVNAKKQLTKHKVKITATSTPIPVNRLLVDLLHFPITFLSSPESVQKNILSFIALK